MPKPDPKILARAFDLPPEQAIAYLQSKGIEVSWNWQEVVDEAAQQAFTVAKAMKMDVLQDIRGAVETALQKGETFTEFQRKLAPTLRAKGWWGKDAAGNQLGSPHRLKTIYRTNLQGSYNAGRWKAQQETANSFPWLEYVAVVDPSTRTTHAAMDGFIARADDPIWDTIYPPNGFQCRCRVKNISAQEAASRGGASPKSQIPPGFPDDGFRSGPGLANWTPIREDYDPDIFAAGEADDT